MHTVIVLTTIATLLCVATEQVFSRLPSISKTDHLAPVFSPLISSAATQLRYNESRLVETDKQHNLSQESNSKGLPYLAELATDAALKQFINEEIVEIEFGHHEPRLGDVTSK
jgi:hypothetical protein